MRVDDGAILNSEQSPSRLGFVAPQPNCNLELSFSFRLPSHAGERQAEIIVSLTQGFVTGYRLLQQIYRVGVTLLFESHSSQSRQSARMFRFTSQYLMEVSGRPVQILRIEIDKPKPEVRFGLRRS